MIDLQDKYYQPALEEICQYVRTLTYEQFCTEIKEQYQCRETIEYSSCSLERGWNIKFKKAGKTLCTIYPRESYFTVMVVVGQKEKERVNEIMPQCTMDLQEIYGLTKEGNGQKWLMIDLEDRGSLYDDVLQLIKIRRG